MSVDTVVYTAACSPRWQSDAARGGPAGELVMTRSLIEGLGAIGSAPRVVTSLKAFVAHRARLGFGRLGRDAPTYFLDPWTLSLACRYHLLAVSDALRVFVLEWFGTPPHRVEPRLRGLSAGRYLVPYPGALDANSFLGFTTDIAPTFESKKAQGVLWGKDVTYLRPEAAAVIEQLTSICELHATMANAPDGALPDHVINHGVLDHDAWLGLLRDSSFVVGLGDPISGPTAIDALAAGCAYLNPVFAAPRQVNGIPELAIRSQHPFASTLGAPFVIDVDLRRPDAVAAAARATLDPAARRAEQSRLLAFLEPFGRTAHRERLHRLLGDT